MSEETEGGSRQNAGLERMSLDRLRDLISNFSGTVLRPPIRAATAMLLTEKAEALRKGPVPLELPHRTVWLNHAETFNPTGPGSAAIDLFELRPRPETRPAARLVRKAVFRDVSIEERLGWIGEALFYLEIAPRIALPGAAIPQLYGCKLEEGSAVLVLEYLEPSAARTSGLERIARSAHVIGILGAATHRDQLFLADWIRPMSPRLPPETLFALESIAAHCIPDGDEQSRIVGAFERLIGSPEIVGRIRAQGYRTLAHGDLHVRNIFPMADKPGDVAVIDWGKVCEGLIGHDAVLLLLPRFIGSPDWAGMEFGTAVELVQRGVIAGALSIDPSLDPARVKVGLEIGLVFQAAILAARNLPAWTSSDRQGRTRTQRLASMLRHVADIVETMLRQNGS